MRRTICVGFFILALSVYLIQVSASKPITRPQLMPQRPECGIFLPERDERHDLARLIRADQFITCERDGFPQRLAPPWKATDEGEKKLGDACEYFTTQSSRAYPQVGQANLKLAANRCRINVMQIILSKMAGGLSQ